MRKIVSAALVGAMMALAGGALAQAADAEQATVADLVKLIAASKKMKVEEVASYLASRGFILELRTPLTERIAADLFGSFGIHVAASRDRAIRSDQIGRLSTLALFTTIQARDPR